MLLSVVFTQRPRSHAKCFYKPNYNVLNDFNRPSYEPFHKSQWIICMDYTNAAACNLLATLSFFRQHSPSLSLSPFSVTFVTLYNCEMRPTHTEKGMEKMHIFMQMFNHTNRLLLTECRFVAFVSPNSKSWKSGDVESSQHFLHPTYAELIH